MKEVPAPKPTPHPAKNSDYQSEQAAAIPVNRNDYGDEIPGGTSGPKYDGMHYAANNDSFHEDK